MDSKVIYLDKLKENQLRIFYQKDVDRFEIRGYENIKKYLDLEALYFKPKQFIDATEEEFKENSEEIERLDATFISVSDDSFELFIAKLRSLLKPCLDFALNSKKLEFSEDRENLINLEELIGLYKFFSRYYDLREDKEYSKFVYYSILDSEA
ncbi:hypothetical protein ACT4JS_003501 [Vibrio cholerae]